MDSSFRDLLRSVSGPSLEEALRSERAWRKALLGSEAFHGLDELSGALGRMNSIDRRVFDGLFSSTGVDAARLLEGISGPCTVYQQLRDHIQQTNESALRGVESMTRAVETARLAGALGLPDTLEPYRTSDFALAAQLADAWRKPWWNSRQLDTLNTHSALSAMFDEVHRVDRQTFAAMDAVLSESLVGFKTLRQASEFLNISGLLRFPRIRRRTRREKQQDVRRRLKNHQAPVVVRKAHGLVHSYEKTLREFIAEAMEAAYGENWAEERLPLCDCKKLLGMPLDEDESVLDGADYWHYIQIMCHPEHFEVVFSVGYKDPEALRETLEQLRRLRARSHHARRFTADDLRQLGALWRVIEKGLFKLTDDVDVDWPP